MYKEKISPTPERLAKNISHKSRADCLYDAGVIDEAGLYWARRYMRCAEIHNMCVGVRMMNYSDIRLNRAVEDDAIDVITRADEYRHYRRDLSPDDLHVLDCVVQCGLSIREYCKRFKRGDRWVKATLLSALENLEKINERVYDA